MFNFSKIFQALSLVGLLTLVSPALASAQNSIGASVIMETSPYKETSTYYLPIPLFNWETEHFYIKGISGGVYLWKDAQEQHKISLGLGMGLQAFDNDRTDNSALEELSDRKVSFDAYLQYQFQSEYGNIGARVAHDILGHADGIHANLWYRLPIYFGKQFVLTPTVGVQYDSAERNDYYYGVSSKESRRSGLRAYDADAGFSPYVGASARYAFTDKIALVASFNTRFLSDEASDSPMVDEDTIYTSSLSIMYSF